MNYAEQHTPSDCRLDSPRVALWVSGFPSDLPREFLLGCTIMINLNQDGRRGSGPAFAYPRSPHLCDGLAIGSILAYVGLRSRSPSLAPFSSFPFCREERSRSETSTRLWSACRRLRSTLFSANLSTNPTGLGWLTGRLAFPRTATSARTRPYREGSKIIDSRHGPLLRSPSLLSQISRGGSSVGTAATGGRAGLR